MKIKTTLTIELNVHQDIVNEINSKPEIVPDLLNDVTNDMKKIIEDELELQGAEDMKIEGNTILI